MGVDENKGVSLLEKIAFDKVEVAFTHSQRDADFHAMLLSGASVWAVMANDPASGEFVHSAVAVMRAYYAYHNAHPEKRVGAVLFEAFGRAFAAGESPEGVCNAIECLLFHMVAQRQARAPFALDTGALLRMIGENAPRYREAFGDAMTERLTAYNVMFRKEFGESFL